MSFDRIRENRLRRMAARQGLLIRKSRRRDIHARDFNCAMLVDERTLKPVFGNKPYKFSATLDDVEAYLLGDRD